MKYLSCVLLFLPLFAQTQPPRQMLPQVREYLQLTNTQVLGIALNNDQYNRSIQERMQRVRQVQIEIVTETGRDLVDPTALGVRYTEIELICRDLRDYANNLRRQNLSLLTERQLTKLRSLEEALKLLPVIIEAQMSNVLATWTTAPNILISGNGSVNINLLGVNAINGCSGTGTLAIR